MSKTHVVAVAGSLRERSYTRLSLRVALESAREAGASTRLVDLREFDLPALEPGTEDPPSVEAFTAAVREADSVLLGTPTYHGSYSGVLKNALDHCRFEEFEHTTVGLLAVAGGSFPVTSLEHLRSVCRSLNAWVLPHQAAVPNARGAFEGEDLVDEDLERRVRVLGRRAVEYASIAPDPATFESDQNEGA